MRRIPLYLVVACGVVVGCKRVTISAATVREEPAAADGAPSRIGNFSAANAFPGYSIVDHGRDCAAELGSAIPEFSCLDGALLEVYVDGKAVRDRIPAKCDNPDLVDPAAACVPGDRLLRIDQGDTTAMIMCRRFRPDVLAGKTPGDQAAVWGVDDARTDNIAMIHFNRKTKAACFYQIRKSGMKADHVVPPYSPETGWKGAALAKETYVAPGLLNAKDACVRCHDNQIWLRTPFVTQLAYADDPKVQRHALPNDVRLGRLRYPGAPFKGWESPEQRTIFIAIDPKMAAVGATEDADADLCTSCHDIGMSKLVGAEDKEGTCQLLARPWLDAAFSGPVEGTFLTAHAVGDRYWMPPEIEEKSAEDYRRAFARPLAALRSCCQNPLQSSCQAWGSRPNPND